MTDNLLNRKFTGLTDYLLPLAAALIICRAFPSLSFFYYLVPIIFLLALGLNLYLNHNLIKTEKNLRLLLSLILLFSGWACITALWSPFPATSISRAAYFLLIAVSSVMLGYNWSKEEKNDLFGYLLPANLIVVITCIYSLITSYPADSWTGGHGLGFKGFASHQNTLASALVFTLPAVLFPVLREIIRKTVGRSHNRSDSVRLSPAKFIIFSVLLAANIILLLESVSRAGVLTVIIILLAFSLLNFKVRTTLVYLLLAFVSFAILFYSSQAVRHFVFKTENKIGDRRIINIHETIDAAKNGGLLGLGYGISQEPKDKRVIGHFENEGKIFVREKMIGVLALIEEVGIIGLSIFLGIIGIGFWGRKRMDRFAKFSFTEDRISSIMILAVMIGYCFHAQIEAWWVGVGSIQLPLFFMILGQGVKRV